MNMLNDPCRGNHDGDHDGAEAHKPRGFAAWDPAKVRETAQKGGIAAHQSGRAHQFSKEEAQRNGRLGGLAMQANRRAKAEKP